MQRMIMILFAIIFFPTIAVAAEKFALTSSEIKENDIISTRYTCDGADNQPSFSWSYPPSNTKTFALLFSDPDAPSGEFYHWIIFNIPNNVYKVSSDQQPSQARLGKNDFGNTQYNGPCPPAGTRHHYVIAVYALDTHLKLPVGAKGSEVIEAMEGHVINTAKVTAVYERKQR